MKNVLMYKKDGIGKSIIDLSKNLWNCDYYTNQSVVPNGRYRNSSLNPIRLIPFDYKGIKFNMITCPAGGKVNVENMKQQVNFEIWGEQQIKEPFMLGETEVTQELFGAVMYFNDSTTFDYKCPVQNVTWYDCLEFCNRLSEYFGLDRCYKLSDKVISVSSIEEANVTFNERANGFRLPKEWEWQIAAMAGTNNMYAGANDDEFLKRVAWFKDNSKRYSEDPPETYYDYPEYPTDRFDYESEDSHDHDSEDSHDHDSEDDHDYNSEDDHDYDFDYDFDYDSEDDHDYDSDYDSDYDPEDNTAPPTYFDYQPYRVAKKLPNEWGFYDMSGNVMEWCENSRAPEDNNNHKVDRVLRGGCFRSTAAGVGTAVRYFGYDSVKLKSHGFRIAKSI